LVNPPATAQCLAAISYEFPWVQCIARFKFGGQPGWAQSLAQIMRQSPGMQEALDQADWVIPMPLSAQRLLQRGYNQAWELARRLSPQKARADLLIRLRDTPAQSQLNRDQRLRNLLGALMVAPATARLLKNSRVLIVDDVMTTGASIQAATEVLKSAGTAWTGACVLARTERPDL
jgi:ComF family protein